MSLSINQNVQLTINVTSDVYSGLIPVQTFEFFINGEKVEIDTLHKGNLGWHYRNPRYSFSLNVYQVGDVTPARILQMMAQNVEFSLTLTKEKGGTWEITNIGWNKAQFTSVRGTGMAPEAIPIISCTAKALEMVLDGKTYGHTLDGT